jgi:hypothetical protein
MFFTLYRWLRGDRAAASSTRTSSVCSETLPPRPSSYTPPSSPTPSPPPSPLPKSPPSPTQCNLNTPPSTSPTSSSSPSLPSHHRIMVSSGRCRSPYCGCPQGIFNLSFVTAENATSPCIGNSLRPGCWHNLSDHEGYPSSDIQGKRAVPVSA